MEKLLLTPGYEFAKDRTTNELYAVSKDEIDDESKKSAKAGHQLDYVFTMYKLSIKAGEYKGKAYDLCTVDTDNYIKLHYDQVNFVGQFGV